MNLLLLEVHELDTDQVRDPIVKTAVCDVFALDQALDKLATAGTLQMHDEDCFALYKYKDCDYRVTWREIKFI